MPNFNFRQASLTVETALLTPLILLVIFSIIYFDFYELNKTICESTAIEQAISGKDYDELPLIAADTLTRNKTENANSRTVSFNTGSYHSPYSLSLWTISSKAVYTYVKPTSFIRKARLLKDHMER